eukprot:scaffold24452_cov61-Phaeocystis_antarctica.AAC.5
MVRCVCVLPSLLTLRVWGPGFAESKFRLSTTGGKRRTLSRNTTPCTDRTMVQTRHTDAIYARAACAPSLQAPRSSTMPRGPLEAPLTSHAGRPPYRG